MSIDVEGLRRVSAALLLVVCLAAAGCADIHPAPDDEGGGLLESPTHEQDAVHETEEREEGGRR
jgi:hypothetical protein